MLYRNAISTYTYIIHTFGSSVKNFVLKIVFIDMEHVVLMQ